MKSFSRIAGLVALMVVSGVVLGADVSAAEIDKLYGMMRQPYQSNMDGDSLVFIRGEMDNHVPPSTQADVVAELMERGAKVKDWNVVYEALKLARHLQGPPKWTNRLANDVVAQAGCDDLDVRYAIVELSLEHADVPHSREVLAAARKVLDEVPEQSRAQVLSELCGFPGAEAAQIRRDYIKAHISDPDRYASVESANPFPVGKADDERGDAFNHIFDDQTPRPTSAFPVPEYLSYVAKYRADPQYNFSVMTVEGIADMVDPALHANRPEFKQVEEAFQANPAFIAKFGDIRGTDIERGPWLNATPEAADPVVNQQGAFQFLINGRMNLIRVSFRWADGKAELTKIEQVAADDSAHLLWSASKG